MKALKDLDGILGLMALVNLSQEAKGLEEVFAASSEASEALEAPVEERLPSKFPLTNIGLAEDGEMVVQIAIPGMTKENIQVEIQGDMLRVIGIPTICEAGEAIQFDMMDVVIKDFVREIKLHDDFIDGEITASVANGILTISIAQYEEPIYSIEVK